MEIVTANASDLTEIVQLLKQSLGEKLLPKSEAFFSWKHFQNPFGESVVLLAKEQGRIIGVRAFMKWQWTNGEETCNAVRAVDTATHPNYQGRGIFSKLTIEALETCKQNNTAFVFNSPNKISIKGYLKLGWYSNGKMPMRIKPVFKLPSKIKDNTIEEVYQQFSIQKALAQINEDWSLKQESSHFVTPISTPYLQWRYLHCTVANYGAIIHSGGFGIVFRLKKHKWFLECRIVEVWLENENEKKHLQNAFREIIQQSGSSFVTCAPTLDNKGQYLLDGFLGPYGIGPEITLRKLALNNLFNFNRYFQWAPSIGSMELF